MKRLELTRTRVRNDLIDIVSACLNLIGLKVEFHVEKDDIDSNLLEDLFKVTPNLVYLHLDANLDLSVRAPDRLIGLEMGPYYLKWAAKSTLRYCVDPSHLTFLGYLNYPASRLI
jgi:hypothetical protein